MAAGGDGRYKMVGEHEYNGVLFNVGMPPHIVRRAKESFEFREDDLVLATYMKVGTTWMQAILYLLNHPEDLERGKVATPTHEFIRFLEVQYPEDDITEMEKLEKAPSPRFIKTHLHFSFIGEKLIKSKSKVIVVFRNPKDTFVSYYHFYRMAHPLGLFKGSWAEFLEMALKGQVLCGSWFDHVIGWWSQKHNPNFLFVKYEDMQRDLTGVVQKVALFCGKPEMATPDMVDKIAKLTSFKEMKANDATNMSLTKFFEESISPFMRKGKVGDWKNLFTVAQNEHFDAVYREKMSNCDLELDFEL